jgi:hypothetical protein
MAYPPKIERALEVLAATGMGRSTYAPLFYRLFWTLGVPIRPPHFQTSLGSFLLMASSYGLGFTAVSWLFYDRAVTATNLASTAIAAASFGLIMTACKQWRVRKHNLPPWSEIDVASRFD